MEEVFIDVRDIDYTWFEDVRAFIDREMNLYLFPKKSADRLGELDEATGDYDFIDGHVRAKRLETRINEQSVAVWCIPIDAVPVRPSSDRGDRV